MLISSYPTIAWSRLPIAWATLESYDLGFSVAPTGCWHAFANVYDWGDLIE
jgi:hypothetical protein